MYAGKLKTLEEQNLSRSLKDREFPQGPQIIFEGKEYINFSSNDYLGLANHPLLIDRAKKAMDKYGFGPGASRLLSGGSRLHKDLEDRISQFKGTETSMVFNSGYAANTGVIPALSDEDTTLFSDEFNHASIIDGCRLSAARTLVYRHKDLAHLKALMERDGSKKKIVITDTVFSMDGDIAPVNKIYDICKTSGAVLYLDEAHATGVIGNGKGALAHFDLNPEPWIVQMGTFSKAFGSYGAFLSASSDVVQWTLNNARSLVFSTALPSCVIAASMVALELIENTPTMIRTLWINREKLAAGLIKIGYDIMGSETPIIPVRTGSIENTLRLSSYLFEKGIFAPAIRPPTVKEARIRITVTAAHTDEDIERLIEALKEA
jgi:8-amino-7-oxononanoate synthase